MQEYKPHISEKKMQKIKAWHEEAMGVLYSTKEAKSESIFGKQIIVLPGVFPPSFPDSKMLAEAVMKEVKQGDLVLDLGTGTGIHAIFATQKANSITATDVNDMAIENAKQNVSKHGLGNKIQVIKSNLFENIGQKFDLIIFNPPFRWFAPKDETDKAETDEDYQTLQKFFSEAKNHLTKNGRILMAFSDSGDIKFFESLIEKNGYQKNVLTEKTIDGWLYKIYRIRV